MSIPRSHHIETSEAQQTIVEGSRFPVDERRKNIRPQAQGTVFDSFALRSNGDFSLGSGESSSSLGLSDGLSAENEALPADETDLIGAGDVLDIASVVVATQLVSEMSELEAETEVSTEENIDAIVLRAMFPAPVRPQDMPKGGSFRRWHPKKYSSKQAA